MNLELRVCSYCAEMANIQCMKPFQIDAQPYPVQFKTLTRTLGSKHLSKNKIFVHVEVAGGTYVYNLYRIGYDFILL